MKEQIDDTAKRISCAMRQARNTSRLSRDDVADMLHIMPNELVAYERGTSKVPMDILQRVFVMAYKLMEIRFLEHHYFLSRKKHYKKTKQVPATS